MSRRKHHNEPHEEHVDESWLIPYADILTLLLALFIVLFASAQVDQKKFDMIAQSFSNAFMGSNSIFDSNHTPFQVNDGQPRSPEQVPLISSSSDDKARMFQVETAQLVEAKRKMDAYIQENKLAGSLETALTEEGLVVRIKETALFPSGSAELIPQSQAFANQIAAMLSTLPQRVIISGHTDNVPINTVEFPTNWDLSSKRALNFMKYLLAHSQLQPERFSAIGYGEYRPVASNADEAGRSKNRRVEVLIVRSYNL